VMLVVNKSDLNLNITEQIKEFANDSNMKFLGEIPYDENVTKAIMNKKAPTEYSYDSPASIQIRDVWNKVTEELTR